jgi:hypothetical protein
LSTKSRGMFFPTQICVDNIRHKKSPNDTFSFHW